jgi:hypothetical protein
MKPKGRKILISFYARNENRTDNDSSNSRHAANTHNASQAVGRRAQIPHSASRTSTRNAQTKAALWCYECEGIGHFASECPTRLQREQGNSQHPRGRNRTERSRRFEKKKKKPPYPTRHDSRKESYSLEKRQKGAKDDSSSRLDASVYGVTNPKISVALEPMYSLYFSSNRRSS